MENDVEGEIDEQELPEGQSLQGRTMEYERCGYVTVEIEGQRDRGREGERTKQKGQTVSRSYTKRDTDGNSREVFDTVDRARMLLLASYV